jgi:FMN phosphatase YigB (HAD superfamily)
VLKILKVKPEEAVVIRDKVDVDVLLPKRLGIKAILLDREKKNVECPAAITTVNNLIEAVEAVTRISKR